MMAKFVMGKPLDYSFRTGVSDWPATRVPVRAVLERAFAASGAIGCCFSYTTLRSTTTF